MQPEFLVHIVDDDDAVRDALLELLDSVTIKAVGYSSANEFFKAFDQNTIGCLVLDIRMPGMSGLELQKRLKSLGSTLPIIFITGHGDIPMAVEATKLGAVDFIQKPFSDQELLDRIQETLASEKTSYDKVAERKLVRQMLESLTQRESEVLELISEGHPNKVIASRMGISQRTVENHRARLFEKLGITSVSGLIRVLILANT